VAAGQLPVGRRRTGCRPWIESEDEGALSGRRLAWGEGSQFRPANRSGVVALESSGGIVDARWTTGLDATLDWIGRLSEGDTLLFVAALAGDHQRPGGTYSRPADRPAVRAEVGLGKLGEPRLAPAGLGHLLERLEHAGWSYSDGGTARP
jgi:hypothetical protein